MLTPNSIGNSFLDSLDDDLSSHSVRNVIGALNLTNASWLNVDTSVLRLSGQDVGSGVGAFLIMLLVLRFVTDRGAPVARIMAASGVVGVVTVLVDLFG